jgi:hypothetical protein
MPRRRLVIAPEAHRRFTPSEIEGQLFDPYSRLLEIHELARVLHMSWRAVMVLRDQGVIPCIRLGKLVRYRLSDVERALEKLTTNAID